jgi:ankyrin repeat protein
LHIASKTNSVDIVRILLDYGANPNSINAFGATPLHIAVKYENLETVKILLVYGADVNAVEFEVFYK